MALVNKITYTQSDQQQKVKWLFYVFSMGAKVTSRPQNM